MNLTNYIKNRINVLQYQIGVLRSQLNTEIAKNVKSQALVDELQTKLDQLTKLYEIKTLGSSTELVNTGKFANVNLYKVYSTVNSIKMNFCTDKWLYNNIEAGLNVLTELVMNDMDNLTANLDTTKLVYLNPYSIENQTTLLNQTRILYYGNFISNTDHTSLDIEFINNQSASLQYLWAKQHLPNKYYTQNGKYLLVGPDISLTNYNFMETVANDPLIKLNVNSTASLTYNVYSDNSEFHVGTFQGDTYLMASKDIKYDNYVNKTIKIKMAISDGTYVYVRVFFITVEKMIKSVAEFISKYNLTKPEDIKTYGAIFNLVSSGKGISIADISVLLGETAITDNCNLMVQLQAMQQLLQGDSKYTDIEEKVSDTVSSFRSINSIDNAYEFATVAKDTISSVFETFSGLNKEILDKSVDGLVLFIESLFELSKIPKSPTPLALSTLETVVSDIAESSYSHKILARAGTANLLQVNTQIEQQQNKNVLPPVTTATGSSNKYELPSDYYTSHKTYKYYISSDLINTISYVDKIGGLYILNNLSYAYPYISKLYNQNYQIYFDAITSDWLNVSDNSLISASTNYRLPDTGTKYDLKIEITYGTDNKTYFKASVNDNVVVYVYTPRKIEEFEIPSVYLVN